MISGSAFDVTRIGARERIISLALGFVSLPHGALIRLIPNEPCERVFKKLQLLPTYELLSTTRPDAEPVFHLQLITCATILRARGWSHSAPSFDTSISSATLWENAFEAHPDPKCADDASTLIPCTWQEYSAKVRRMYHACRRELSRDAVPWLSGIPRYHIPSLVSIQYVTGCAPPWL